MLATPRLFSAGLLVLVISLPSAAPAPCRAESAGLESEDRVRARDDRIEALEQTLVTVVEELERVRSEVALPEDKALKGAYGYGPAASKIYGLERGLSIGGYGEAFYRNYIHDQGSGSDKKLDDADFLRFVLYFGYKFSDSIIFNSEIEIEHASTSEDGEVSVEFASLDFLWKDAVNFRAGMLLLPMGFINEIHEPPFFYGVQRPLTERSILPATWRENGAGIFGRIGESFEYRSYVVNGFDATGFSDAGIRGGRQKGSKALAEDLAWVGRMDWTPVPELMLGGSLYVGKSGQDQTVDGEKLPDARLTMWELHAQYQKGPFHTRGLFAMSQLSNAGALNRALGNAADDAIAERMLGGYVETAYDVWPLLFGEGSKVLAPFFRVEYVDTQDKLPSGFVEQRDRATWLFTQGLQFKPHPNVVLKAEYRNFQQRKRDAADEISFGVGYAF